jgi:hypothetical protein
MATDPFVAVDAKTSAGDEGLHGHSVLAEEVAGWQWVRLAHVGSPSYLVLLKISPNADEHDAVRALEWWLLSPGREDGDVLEVL